MTLNEIRVRINSLVDTHTETANRVIRSTRGTVKLLVTRPKVSFFNKTRRAGWCNYFTNEVGFNEILARDNWTEFENTVIHEIAHLATNNLFPNAKQYHGPEFRWVMRQMGGSGETYHNYDVSSVKKDRKAQKRYVYKCSCQEHKISGRKHSAIKNGSVYRCVKCRDTIKYTMKSMG
jgi:SprT protein